MLVRRLISTIVLGTFISANLAGCATKGSEVQAGYVPVSLYSNLTCEQIAQELYDVGLKAGELSGQLDTAAGKDAGLVAVGIILFWPALFFVGGDKSKEAQLAQLKGTRDALIKAGRAKGCKLDSLGDVVKQEMANTPPAAQPDVQPVVLPVVQPAPK